MRQNILDVAKDLFLLHGIRAVKMDDIAASLKMSKRTLYECYDNKKDLLFDVLTLILEMHHKKMEAYSKTCSNVMDMLIELFRIQTDVYAQTNPLFFKDLERYPDLFDKFHELHEDRSKAAREFFKRGVEEEYFRSNVNYEIILQIGNDVSMLIRTNEKYKVFSAPEVFYSYVCTMIRGICTEKGVARIDEFIANLKNKDAQE